MKERCVVDYIKSLGRDTTTYTKRSFTHLRCTKLEFISIWKGRPKETTVQAKLSVQVYKSDCASVTDRWI